MKIQYQTIPLTLCFVLIFVGCERAPAGPWLRYTCDNGQPVAAWYTGHATATIRYQGKTRMMYLAMAASGARHRGDDLTWWTKGSGVGASGTLFRHAPNSDTDQMITHCVQR